MSDSNTIQIEVETLCSALVEENISEEQRQRHKLGTTAQKSS